MGFYRPRCSGSETADSACTPCSIGGCPYNHYRPKCVGLFAQTDSPCTPCTTASCPAGLTRTICGELAQEDAVCLECRQAAR